MDYNRAVRPSRSDIGLSVVFLISEIFSLLFKCFEDKEAAEERKKQNALWYKQTVSKVFSLDGAAGSLATGLNELLQYVTHLQQAIGIQDGLAINPVTPEGVIYVAKWIFLLLICYGAITLGYVLATFFLRCLWWLLKVVVALAFFGLILNDDSVDKTTMVFRLLGLGCFCIVLSIRPLKDRINAAKYAHLEKQVKILENQVKGMDKWRIRCIKASCCLMGILCFMGFIAFRVYKVISDS